ncbi:MAG TPA: CBS domain-containing protein, partial [Thermoanaerobaculia bacterium]|nr:CBS domain-containing protein [Thermoanaerobaculia bacterium]
MLQPALMDLIETKNWDAVRDELRKRHPSDVAELIIALPAEPEAFVFRALSRDQAADVFSYLPPAHQEELIHSLTNEQVRGVLQAMPPDDRARLLDEMPAEVTRRLLGNLSPEDLKNVRWLLGYPEHTAGRYMTPKYVTVDPNMTAREALDHIRSAGRGMETINVVYIVDDRGKLVEDVRLASLVLADADTSVTDIADPALVALKATEDREEVAKMFERYDRVALPVTDAEGRMLGIITVDDVLDVAEQEATEDI